MKIEPTDKLALLVNAMRAIESVNDLFLKSQDTREYAPDEIINEAFQWHTALKFIDDCYPGRFQRALNTFDQNADEIGRDYKA